MAYDTGGPAWQPNLLKLMNAQHTQTEQAPYRSWHLEPKESQKKQRSHAYQSCRQNLIQTRNLSLRATLKKQDQSGGNAEHHCFGFPYLPHSTQPHVKHCRPGSLLQSYMFKIIDFLLLPKKTTILNITLCELML